MSWLAKSFANLIVADEEDDGGYGDDRRGNGGKATSGEAAALTSPAEESNGEDDGSGDVNLGKGVKEDLTELSKTLTRQFWGVASFLAPPPAASPQTSSLSSADADFNSVDRNADSDLHPPAASSDSADPDQIDYSPRIGGIRNDFAEIGGRFRSGISKLSSAKAVSEISKIASSFLQFGSDGEGEEIAEEQELRNKLGSGGIEAIGVTEEVLAFAQNISMHPETWLDFPLFSDDEATDDFDMSDAQQEHALAVEYLVPRLAALRIELCPSHISEGNFWKIYFVLLHPRLNKHDAELLSTPQIVEARALLLQDLQSRTKSSPIDWSSSTNKKEETSSEDESSTNPETVKHSVAALELRVVDKAVIEEDVPVHIRQEASPEKEISATVAAPDKLEDNGDEWLEDESAAAVGGEKISAMAIADDEDVSFSDLEEDDETLQDGGAASAPPAISTASKLVAGKLPEEANEWSDLDDLDVA